ncbi:MAG: carboxypeptidase regulatory-like domain-containing protein [Planctomycetes bacterium]|nr:carboxypeptidase regulatory-like domain-containing protein [Planctomycetota bacterium]
MRGTLVFVFVGCVLALAAFFFFSRQRPVRAPVAIPSPASTSSTASVLESTPNLAPAPEIDRELAPTSSVAEAPPDVADSEAWPRARVFGRAVDDEGQPVAKLHLSLSSVSKEWAPGQKIPTVKLGRYQMSGFETKSDDDGRFEFDVPVPTSDWISLHTDAPDFLGIAGRDFGTAGGRNRPPLKAGDNDVGDLILAVTGAVSGEVRAADGGVIPKAEVRLEGSFPGGFSVQTVSDANGRFVLGHVPEGTFAIGAKAEGYLSATVSNVEVKKRATTPGIAFRLEPAPQISGRVLDEHGNPIEGVRMWGWPVSSGQGAGARSKSDGSFTIHLPQNEPYQLEVQSKGFEPWGGHGSDKTFGPGTSDVVVSLKRVASVTFVVVDAARGEAIERYGILIEDRPREGQMFGSSRTEPEIKQRKQGECTAPADPARHVVRIVAPGYADSEADVRYDEPAVARQTLRLKTGATLHGRVSQKQQPVPGATLKLERDRIKIDPSKADDPDDIFSMNFTHDLSDFLGRPRMRSADEQGTFRIEDLPPGTYRLTASGGTGAPRTLGALRVEDGATRDLGVIELEDAGVVNGRVVLGPGQVATEIELHLDDDWTARSPITSATGAFTFKNVAAGAHVLHVRSGRGDVEQVPFDIAAGETKELVVDISSKAPCTVRVRVTRGGRPEAGVTVDFRVQSGEVLHDGGRLGTTGADGIATGSLPGGMRAQFVARADSQFLIGRGTVTADLVAGALYETEIAVRSGELVVLFPATMKIPDKGGFSVTLKASDDPDGMFQHTNWSTAQSAFHIGKDIWKDHRCVIGALAPGEYDARVGTLYFGGAPDQSPLFKPFQGKIKIEDDKTTVVEIESL